MTLVHAETGEVLSDADVIEEFTEHEARAFVGRINASLHITGEMIIEAYDRRIWKALGYRTWDDFTQQELGGPAMNPAQRAVLAVGLRQAGMSLRAIASATGSSPQTIMRDTEGVTVPDGTVTSLDGISRPATQPDRSGESEDREASAPDAPQRDTDVTESSSPDPLSEGTAAPEPDPLPVDEPYLSPGAVAVIDNAVAHLRQLDGDAVAQVRVERDTWEFALRHIADHPGDADLSDVACAALRTQTVQFDRH